MSEVKEYHIKTLEDFFRVPLERLDACLNDFRTYLAVVLLARTATEVMGRNADEVKSDGFIWIDDGKQNATVTVHVKEKTEERP